MLKWRSKQIDEQKRKFIVYFCDLILFCMLQQAYTSDWISSSTFCFIKGQNGSSIPKKSMQVGLEQKTRKEEETPSFPHSSLAV